MRGFNNRAVSFILTFCMILTCIGSIPTKIRAASVPDPLVYVALGDSIATGYGLSGYRVGTTPLNSYCSLVGTNIQADQVINLGVDGLNSTYLLAALQRQDVQAAIAGADIITLSIGSNDLMGPFLQIVANAFGCSVAELGSTISSMYATNPAGLMTRLAALNTEQPTGLINNPILNSACGTLLTNFPQIINTIKSIGPHAKIYVTNAYNPYKGVSLDYVIGTLNLGAITEGYIHQLNTAFSVQSSDYTLVDIHSAFNGSVTSLINANISTYNFDPHPNAAGHALIAEKVTEAIGTSPAVSATLSPATASFDKNPAHQSDVITTITWNGATTLSDVKNAGVSVGSAVYSVSGNTLTIHKEYLASQTTGSLALKVEFNKGNAADLTIQISDTTSPVGSNPPTWPAASTLTASGTTKTGTTLNWTAAEDDLGVTGYRIYQANSLLQTVTGAVYSYNITGLSPATSYTFKIQAGDVNNHWTEGPSVTVRTYSSYSGGSGGGIYIPTATPELKPTAQLFTSGGNETEAITPVLDKSTGIAVVEVKEAVLTHAFDQSATNAKGGKTVEIVVPKIEGAKTYEPTLPASAFNAGNASKTVKIKTDIATVSVPCNMLAAAETTGAKNVSLAIAAGDKSKLNPAVQAQIGNRPIVELNLKIDGKLTSWSNGGAPVTVTLPYSPTDEELKDSEHIVIFYIDGSGAVVPVPNGRYDRTSGTVTFITTHFSQYAVSYVHKTFSDLESVEWARKSIEVMASKGIINGSGIDTYSPSAYITRADYLVLLVKALGLTIDFDGNFEDVKPGTYYYEAVGMARKLGIASGEGNNLFHPQENISRQDMMVMTARVLRLLGKLNAVGDFGILEQFSDKADIAGYAAENLSILVKEGLVTGSGNKLNSAEQTTRAEAAVFLYRIYNKY